MKKVFGLMKDVLGGKIRTKFVELRAKAYWYLINRGSEDKKSGLQNENLNLKTVKIVQKQLNFRIK